MSDARIIALTHAVEFHKTGVAATPQQVSATAQTFLSFLTDAVVIAPTPAANPTAAPAAEQTTKPRQRRQTTTTTAAAAAATPAANATPQASAAPAASGDLPDPTSTATDDGFGDAPTGAAPSFLADEPPAPPAKEWKKEDVRAALTAYFNVVGEAKALAFMTQVSGSSTVSGIDKTKYEHVIKETQKAFLAAGGKEGQWPIK